MTTNNMLNSPEPFAIGIGGTGVTSVTIAPTATAWAGWDANKNLSANSFLEGYTTTATAAGTTTLLVGSTELQFFTGSTTQTVLLPVTSTLVLGQTFKVINNSSGVVTVQSSGGNAIQAQAASTTAFYTCILTSGTTAASWSVSYIVVSAAGKNFSTVIQKFAATGTYTPTAGMVNCDVEAVAAGGGAGGAVAGVGSQYNSAGGGAGSYSKGNFTAAAIGASKAVVIGSPGAGGSGAGSGAGGADTTFGTTLLVAKGGSGGGSVNAPGGLGGVAGTGTTLAIPGGNGGAGASSVAVTNGFAPAGGGNSMWGQGGAPLAAAAAANGNAGTGYGAGGGGCNTYNSASTFSGGAGTIGYLIVTEYIYA